MNTGINELDDEAKLNRGFVTIYEQVKPTEAYDEGEQFISLGKGHVRNKLVETDEGNRFIPHAVPIAEFELHKPLESEDEIKSWANSDVGQLVLSTFCDEMESPNVLTGHGIERAVLATDETSGEEQVE